MRVEKENFFNAHCFSHTASNYKLIRIYSSHSIFFLPNPTHNNLIKNLWAFSIMICLLTSLLPRVELSSRHCIYYEEYFNEREFFLASDYTRKYSVQSMSEESKFCSVYVGKLKAKKSLIAKHIKIDKISTFTRKSSLNIYSVFLDLAWVLQNRATAELFLNQWILNKSRVFSHQPLISSD